MQVALAKIVVKPGQQLLLQDVNWLDFEEILEELGEHRSSKISYSNGLKAEVKQLELSKSGFEIIFETS